MKQLSYFARMVTTLFLLFVLVSPQYAQFSKFDKLKQARLGKKGKFASGGGGEIVFSSQPINAQNPSNLTRSFSAGDKIYALFKVDQPWVDLKKIGNRDKTEAKVPLIVFIDGQRLFQYITIKNTDLARGKTLLLDIAPDPGKMKTYSDPNIIFPDAYGSKWGPATFTDKISELSSGSHTIKMEVSSYGRVYAAGSFNISGTDYGSYATLHEQIKNVIASNRGMPVAKMKNSKLEEEMLQLCENAGIENIKKLIIVDKDWWLDRVDGGNTPIKSRHMAAAVGIKEGSNCYYKTVTFHQYKLITGGFGPLEFTHASDKVVLPDNSL